MRDIASENVLKQQKARAQRIDHDYHAKPHPWRTLMTRLSWGLPIIGVLALGAMTFSANGVLLYEPGPVSTRHSMFNHRCEDCHEKDGGKFGAVTNAKCLVCHDGPLHNHRQVHPGPDKLKTLVAASQFSSESEVEVNTGRCASCHTEHKGNQRLVRMNDGHCTQCHLDLKVNDGGKLLFKSGIESFQKGHPEWKSLREDEGDVKGVGKDGTPIKFNHAAHMNAKKVKYKESSVKGDRGLNCDDCHKPDDQRKYMQPISYDKHCAECHELKTVNGTLPPPHGPTEAVRSHVRAQFLVDMIAEKKAPPAKKEELDTAIEALLTEDLFTVPAEDERAKDGSCLYCHVQDTKVNSKLVIKPNIPYRWFKHSFFNHQTHRVINCEDCHAKARTSSLTTDVLLPGIQSCQKCHNPGGARADCNECHLYHDKTHQTQNGTLSIDGLMSGGAGKAVNPDLLKKPEVKKVDEKKVDEKKPDVK